MEGINRSNMISLEPGQQVRYRDKRGFITGYVDLESILVREILTGSVERVLIDDIEPPIDEERVNNDNDLSLIEESEWNLAEQRLEIIAPLLEMETRTRADVTERAAEFNKHTNTVYKWIRGYESQGIRGLMKKTRRDSGAVRLDDQTEAIIKENIDTYYLARERRSVAYVHRAIASQCKGQGLTAPHENTIRKRINAITEKERLKKRFGHQVAANKYDPVKGVFPGAETPFAIYQMDHTTLDIIVVDEEDRRAIGTPTITMVADVCSRMVAGFNISFEPPSALAAGLCLAHAILPKDEWLSRYPTKNDWPVWGSPAVVHVDNASEFRGNMLRHAALEYQFSIEFRPVARPNYGGHIERLLGTFSQELKSLPGSKFSNTQERANYPAEKRASLTLSELEEWLTVLIVDGYHQTLHSNLDTTPFDRFRSGIMGDGTTPGVGLKPKITDTQRVRLDFLPIIERSISNEGVVIDNIHYYHDVLRHWINTKDPSNKKQARKFLFRRDPRDISTIWFFDPDLRQYFPIPYRDLSRPSMSLWELRKARKAMLKKSREKVDEHELFDAYERLRDIEREAVKKTLSTRRAKARRDEARKKVIKPTETPETSQFPPSLQTEPATPVEPFDGLMEDFDEA